MTDPARTAAASASSSAVNDAPTISQATWREQREAAVVKPRAPVKPGPGGCGPHCLYVSETHSTTSSALARHYALNAGLLPMDVARKIMRLSIDAETQAFLDSCASRTCVDTIASFLCVKTPAVYYAARTNVMPHLLYSKSTRWNPPFLRRRPCLSVTDVNGILCRGQMFVLSTEATSTLLAGAVASSGRRSTRLLDVGAGDGGVTAKMAPLFTSVVATEASIPMVWRLRLRGYSAVRTMSIARPVFAAEDGAFDVVSIMNVLDRCDDPLGLLSGAARLAAPRTGRVLVALVLPFNEFVEDGARRRAPKFPLPMDGARCGDGATFEASLAAFVARVLPHAGLELETLTRVPYLCRGDHRKPFYVLSDAVMVLKHAVNNGRVARSTGCGSPAVCDIEDNAGIPLDSELRRTKATHFRT